MKIKNVIFDIGGVLLDWKPIELLKEMTDEKKAVVKFNEEVSKEVLEKVIDEAGYKLIEIK